MFYGFLGIDWFVVLSCKDSHFISSRRTFILEDSLKSDDDDDDDD